MAWAPGRSPFATDDPLAAEEAAVLRSLGIPMTKSQRATALHARDAAIDEELMQALERWEALSIR